MKKALITGVTGQDGSYLAEMLIKEGYEVHGIKRRASSFNTQRIDHIYEDPHGSRAKLRLHYGDLTDSSNLTRIISEVEPDEIYNLGAQSHVGVSFETPGIYGQCRRARGAPDPRGDPLPRPRNPGPLLSGLDVGALWPGPGDTAARGHAVLPEVAVWCGEALRPLDHDQLPRILWNLCLQRHPLQS